MADYRSETKVLAQRFLGVFQQLMKITSEETPDDVIAQLSVNQLRALHLIYRQPGISQKALAERLEVTAAAVSIWISRMLESHLVERRASGADARVMHLYLGAYGQELVRKVEDSQVSSIADLLEGLPLDEQQRVVEALERALVIHDQKQQVSMLSAEE